MGILTKKQHKEYIDKNINELKHMILGIEKIANSNDYVKMYGHLNKINDMFSEINQINNMSVVDEPIKENKETLIEIFENIEKKDKRGFFTIEVNGKKYKCRELG